MWICAGTSANGMALLSLSWGINSDMDHVVHGIEGYGDIMPFATYGAFAHVGEVWPVLEGRSAADHGDAEEQSY